MTTATFENEADETGAENPVAAAPNASLPHAIVSVTQDEIASHSYPRDR